MTYKSTISKFYPSFSQFKKEVYLTLSMISNYIAFEDLYSFVVNNRDLYSVNKKLPAANVKAEISQTIDKNYFESYGVQYRLKLENFEWLIWEAIKWEHFNKISEAITERFPLKIPTYIYYQDAGTLSRQLTITILSNNISSYLSIRNIFSQGHYSLPRLSDTLIKTFGGGLKHKELLKYDNVIITDYLLSIPFFEKISTNSEFFLLIENKEDLLLNFYVFDFYASLLFFSGKFEKLRNICTAFLEKNIAAEGYLLAIDYLHKKKPDEFLPLINNYIKRYRKVFGKRTIVPDTFAMVILSICVIHSKSVIDIDLLRNAKRQESDSWYNMMNIVFSYANYLYNYNESVLWERMKYYIENSTTNIFNQYVALIVASWVFSDKMKTYVSIISKIRTLAKNNNNNWVDFQLSKIYSSITQIAVKDIDDSTNFDILDLSSIVYKEKQWEKTLRMLEGIVVENSQTKTKTVSDKRIIWHIDFSHNEITPRLQSLNKNGSWSAGRNIALSKLYSRETEAITHADEKAIKNLKKEESYWNGSRFEFVFDETFYALAEHPYVFDVKSPDVNLEIVKAEPELIIEQSGGNYVLQISPKFTETGIMIHKESLTRYLVYRITEKLLDLQITLTKNNKIPTEAGTKFMDVVKGLSGLLTIHSDVAITNDNILQIDADSRIYLLLMPYNDGLKAQLLVKPFTETPPYFKPMEGRQSVITSIEGRKKLAKRNLQKEEENLNYILDNCSFVNSIDEDFLFDTPESSLEFLSQVEVLKDNLVMEWPEGVKFKIAGKSDFKNFKLSLNSKQDWFSVNGSLTVNENTVLEIKELLKLLDNSEGRFIRLEDKTFLELTQSFYKKLQDFKAFTHQKNNSIGFHSLTGLAFHDFFNEIEDFTPNEKWKKQVELLARLENLNPRVPATLQAELRNYQREGYVWLARLAEWGVGACLADDMGLGKTIQAIALLLRRAAKGPALVIAPASVVRNWEKEILRFAPTLQTVVLQNKDRETIIQDIGEYGVLLLSYGLLQSEEEIITAKNWHTIVLDEAHAIKNNSTKTSKAAMKLNGNFKLITTGTPIQNHLGELWNLFNFINPGLLGSEKEFQNQYMNFSSQEQEKASKLRLKKIIAPFILRRNKTQVLEELPEKTEITLTVTLSKEETAFYEALRRTALENLEADSSPDGKKHLKILAEIMKLRRACCNTQLVNEKVKLPSSKLDVFAEVVTELLANNHKALVFSQFVGHLSLIREYLDKNNITYQYLDGSTPIAKREEGIKAFQAGESDLFLISLKAGGLGLNLTAADYVIHMDPWWNPAVEDQASDRAHRIGQKRPVTIYRLVTKGTIEEKIVDLHKNKRDLADNLLEGTDHSAKVSAKELLDLMREQF